MNGIVPQDDGKGKAGRPTGAKNKVKDKSSFLTNGHDFDKVIKKLERQIEKAVDVLAKIADDSTVDPKERRQAAENLLKHYSSMVDARSKDQMTRLIAEYKIRGINGNGSTADDEDDDTPMLDFQNIHPDFADQEVLEVTFKETNKEKLDK